MYFNCYNEVIFRELRNFFRVRCLMVFMNFPHKNLLLSAPIALIIIGVGFYFNHNSTDKNPSPALQDLPLQAEASTSPDLSDRDSDGDGLPDWEEHLYGSDPLVFDTDKDGTPDGEEVRQGRDPTKANTAPPGTPPNDYLPTLSDPHFATSSSDILGIKKEFFAKFLTTEGQNIRATTYRDLIKQFDPKKVSVKNELIDLNVSSDNSVVAMREYGNAFGELIKKYSVHPDRTEKEIMADAIKQKSDIPLKELQGPAIWYRNFSADLKVLKVPSTLAKSHLHIVSGYEAMYKGLLAMQTLHADPINGAGGYEAYTKGKIDVTNGYAGIVVLFAKNNVTFTLDEAGVPFYLKPLHTGSTTKAK